MAAFPQTFNLAQVLVGLLFLVLAICSHIILPHVTDTVYLGFLLMGLIIGFVFIVPSMSAFRGVGRVFKAVFLLSLILVSGLFFAANFPALSQNLQHGAVSFFADLFHHQGIKLFLIMLLFGGYISLLIHRSMRRRGLLQQPPPPQASSAPKPSA